MSLSDEEELAFLELSQRHRDVRLALRRRYAAWQARQYSVVAGFFVGTALVVIGLLWVWPLWIAGSGLALLSSLAVTLRIGRRPRGRQRLPQGQRPRGRQRLPQGQRPEAWRGLMA